MAHPSPRWGDIVRSERYRRVSVGGAWLGKCRRRRCFGEVTTRVRRDIAERVDLWYEVFMKSVPIHELKRHLSDLIDAAAGGERILITRHNRPVASLVPVEPAVVHTGASFGRAHLRPVSVRSTRPISATVAEDRSEDR